MGTSISSSASYRPTAKPANSIAARSSAPVFQKLIAARNVPEAPLKPAQKLSNPVSTPLQGAKNVAKTPVKSPNAASIELASRANSAAATQQIGSRQSTLATVKPVPAPSTSATHTAPAASVKASEVQTVSTVVKPAAQLENRLTFNVLQQNWLDSNAGPYANLLVNSLNRSEPYSVDPLPLQWANFSTGRSDGMFRAVGNIQKETAKELAAVLGGQVVDSPFGTFGTQSRDKYIRMPNGQMIDASVLAENLNAARESRDPFSGLQAMLDVYQNEARQFNPGNSTNAIDRVSDGRFGGPPQVIPT